MNKIIVICFVFLTTLITTVASANEPPLWVQNANGPAWEKEIAGVTYVYAAAVSPSTEKMTHKEARKNYNLAIDQAIIKLQKQLKVDNLYGLEILPAWYDGKNVYVLCAVPKALNGQSAAVQTAPTVEANGCNLKKWWEGPDLFECERCGRKYLYAIGTAQIENQDEKTARKKAEELAQQALKSHLRQNELKEYFQAGYHRLNNQVWILGRVPLDQSQASAQVEPVIENTAITTEQIISYADSQGIITKDHIPVEYWNLYTAIPKKNPTEADYLKNVFRFGNDIYAIGHGLANTQLPETQQRPGALRAAKEEAVRNLALVLNGAVTKYKGEGNYTIQINGLVQNAQEVQVEGIENPHYENGQNPVGYVLLKITLKPITI